MADSQGSTSPVIAAGNEARSKTNPIVVIAAISVIVFSAVGVGVMTGIIPSSFSRSSEQQAVQKPEPLLSAAPTPAPVSQPASKQAAPKPATRVAAAPKAPAPPAPERVQEPVRAVAPAPAQTAAARICNECGSVIAVDAVKQQGEGSGLGAVAGGVAGALLGNQVGGGSGRRIATVAGAAGGAYAGHQAEKYLKSGTRYDVVVRMEDGTNRSFSFENEPGYRVGDKVKVVDGKLIAN